MVAPSIKVFEEDVDMELENERRQSTESENASNIPKPDAVKTSETIKPTDQTAVSTSDKSSKLLPEKETEPPATNDNATAEPKPDDSNTVEEKPSTPKIESFAAAMSSTNSADVGSRFYIKRRIIVGNVSKYIAPGKITTDTITTTTEEKMNYTYKKYLDRRDPLLKQFTHKWMIYVVEPPQSKQEVSAFITCVRFHLHPSYKPNDVIDVTEAPFKLTRLGWGEFPIRIQLFFVDKKRNKTVDLIHHLKLDDSHSGKQLLGSERSIEIELDRNTDFKDTSSVPTSLPVIQQPQQQDIEPPAAMAVRQKMSLLGGILKECVRKLPIVRAGKIL
ncbi:hypothetical protein HPULCUR_005482 [Helicostylum pulchrum]|uniref:Protein AF-9 homolog n=1 Tax=Helicostylum pulchrum TaxID=562976 RepID=A0ABP9Y0H1_9FUNG